MPAMTTACTLVPTHQLAPEALHQTLMRLDLAAEGLPDGGQTMQPLTNPQRATAA